MGYEYSIIGAGPAGAAAAAVLARRGYRVAVYEALPSLGVKPCGRGIPSLGDLPVEIPKESVVRMIRGARLYVDGKLAVEIWDGLEGVIVDKGLMLDGIIASSGADLYKRAYYKPGQKSVRVGGRHHPVGPGLFAAGHGYYRGEKIVAVQYRLKSSAFEDMDWLDIWFDTGLIGYFYIFPNSGDEADVGVGGFADADTLWKLLDKFISSHEDLEGSRIVRKEGARIAVGGLDLGLVDGMAKVGEAAGFVLPLTGEGIRPSMISGATAAEALASGRDPLEAMSNSSIARAVRFQRRILERVKLMSRKRRAELLMEIPAEAHALIALGRIDIARLALTLARKPRLLARLVRLMA